MKKGLCLILIALLVLGGILPLVAESEPQMDPELVYRFYEKTWPCNASNQDAEVLYENHGNVNDACRFADMKNYIIYAFDITDSYSPSVAMRLSNNYIVECSNDLENWTELANWMKNNAEVKNRGNQGVLTFSPYDSGIYTGTYYIRLRDCDESNGFGACIDQVKFSYYKLQGNGSTNIFNLNDSDKRVVKSLVDEIEPTPVDEYEIASDGGLIYNPISREKADSLEKYDTGEFFEGTLTTKSGSNTVTVHYEIPKAVTAYDAVPVYYTVESDGKLTTPVHLSATAYEDSAAEGDKVYYDLNLPGRVALEMSYLGYVGGTNKLNNRPRLNANIDTTKEGAQYPQYTTTDLIESGVVGQYDLTWFKFAYTNTGDTVLEGDGNGTFCFEPILYRKNGNSWQQAATAENLYIRITEPLYPGQSGEMYVTFNTKLNEGIYKLEIRGLVRNETANPENYGSKIWGGFAATRHELIFEVGDRDTVVEASPVTNSTSTLSRNRWLHTYEEFMSSYTSLLGGVNGSQSGVMYLQCAPWTDRVVLKLMTGNEDNMTGVALPVAVESDSITVRLNPDCDTYVVLADGTRFPAISAQSMADMRGNVQLGPDAAANVISNLTRMQNAGINLVNTTAAFEYDSSNGTSAANNIDACWFSLDVMRLMGLNLEGWVSYPYESTGNLTQANNLFNLTLSESGYGSEELAKANALNALYQFRRWGDNYWIGGNNTLVLDVEDTRGWMRVDFNARSAMNGGRLMNYQTFLRYLYGNDIDDLNDDWGTNYATFADINPETGTTDDHGMRNFRNDKLTFGEWSLPLSTYDVYRTLERIKDYQMVLENLAQDMPTAKLNMRTEGANWVAVVDPYTTNSHLRHVYYSQRRCGIIPELLGRSGVLYAASDYTTLPYTPSEVAQLTAGSRELGIVPMLLPQFDRMRDIAVNSKWGNDFSYDYNIRATGGSKGAYISTVCSVFEWFRATYENGGVPGILYQDYLCDGYMTETQYKEIQFFTQKLKEALGTSEGENWARNFTQDPSVRADSAGAYSYPQEYVLGLINEYRTANGMPAIKAPEPAPVPGSDDETSGSETGAESDSPNETEKPEDEKKSGCGSALPAAAGLTLLLGAVGLCVLAVRNRAGKKED
ncbi:MAG: hypothetical protein IJU20_03765 [Clostridia bacterium]|nr:hypothetical protein [Clostridia bacterium]